MRFCNRSYYTLPLNSSNDRALGVFFSHHNDAGASAFRPDPLSKDAVVHLCDAKTTRVLLLTTPVRLQAHLIRLTGAATVADNYLVGMLSPHYMFSTGELFVPAGSLAKCFDLDAPKTQPQQPP